MRYDLVDEHYPLEPDPAFRRRAAWMLARLEGQAGGEVLDVGCGQGFYFPLYARLGLRIAGVESDPLPLAEARRRAAALGAEVAEADAETLPFADGRFDAVVMSEVLEHLDTPARALAEAQRVLKPGGLLLVTVPHARYPFLWDPINRTLEGLGASPIRRGLLAGIWANHQRLYTAGVLRDAVEAAGFAAGPVIFQTRRCLPFTHNLVYGFGRALLEGGLLPRAWTGAGLRGAAPAEPAPTATVPAGPAPAAPARRPGRLNPVALAVALLRFADRGNPDFTMTPGPSVNLLLAARRLDTPPPSG